LKECNRPKTEIPIEDGKNIRRVQKNEHVHARHDLNNANITEILDTIKHMLAVKSQRLGRYKEANGRKQQNRLYSTSEKPTGVT